MEFSGIPACSFGKVTSGLRGSCCLDYALLDGFQAILKVPWSIMVSHYVTHGAFWKIQKCCTGGNIIFYWWILINILNPTWSSNLLCKTSVRVLFVCLFFFSLGVIINLYALIKNYSFMFKDNDWKKAERGMRWNSFRQKLSLPSGFTRYFAYWCFMVTNTQNSASKVINKQTKSLKFFLLPLHF